EPAFKRVAPGIGVIMNPPVSVCHQVSITGHFSLPIFFQYHSQASGLIGSPTEPRMRREERSVPSIALSPSAISARIRAGAVYRMLTWCLSTTWHVRAGVGQFGTPSNISVVAPQASGPYSR